jgi:hypothetical protein
LISNFRRVLNIVDFLWGNSPASGELPHRKSTILDTIVFDCVWYSVARPLNRWANFTSVCINPIHFSFKLKQFYRVAS